jgi:hypothetical protein
VIVEVVDGELDIHPSDVPGRKPATPSTETAAESDPENRAA